MPRGEKSKYTDKQERKADPIAEGYKKRSASSKKRSDAPGRPSTRTMAAANTAVPTSPEALLVSLSCTLLRLSLGPLERRARQRVLA
jgi:hypothetical protein